MWSIPVYTQSAVNAAIADGTMPQTAATPAPSSPTRPAYAPASTTAAAAATSSYLAAQAGAPAVPAPTSSASQRYAPVQPTRTTKTDDGPAAPQPGAVPTPDHSMKSSLPPPPKAGEIYNPPQPTVAPQAYKPQPYPAQMSMLPPTTSYGGQPRFGMTRIATGRSGSYPTHLPSQNFDFRRGSLEHPPGRTLPPILICRKGMRSVEI
jgi:hypothetical protein